MSSPETLAERLLKLYELVERCEGIDSTDVFDSTGACRWQDHFALAMEDCTGNPCAMDNWQYTDSDVEGIGRVKILEKNEEA